MNLNSSIRKFSPILHLRIVLIVVISTIAFEYFFRHYVLFWLPVIGNLNVNDMISLTLAYTLLTLFYGLVLHLNWKNVLQKVGYALIDMMKTWKNVIWILLIMLSLILLPLADRYLWHSIKLPLVISTYRNPLKCLVPYASILKVISFILVNGLFVPIAEEFLWRGIIQVQLIYILPKSLAIATTAIFFSVKHVLVDASFGRFLTLFAFGIICGIVAERKNWHASAALHLFVNTITTIMGLLMGLE